MVDFINEVEEELRKDDYNKLLKRYGPLIALIIFLIVAGTAAFEWNKTRTDRTARAASASYLDAAKLAIDGENDKAVSAFLALADQAPEGYSGLSLMRAATIEQEVGNVTRAVALYDQAANVFAMPRHADLASLKAAYLLADNGAYSEVQARLDPLAAKDAPYEFLARELAGFVAYETGDMNTARQEFNYLKNIPGVPTTIAERASQFLSLVPAATPSEAIAPEPVDAEMTPETNIETETVDSEIINSETTEDNAGETP